MPIHRRGLREDVERAHARSDRTAKRGDHRAHIRPPIDAWSWLRDEPMSLPADRRGHRPLIGDPAPAVVN